MIKSPGISVVIPTYKAAAFIQETLASVFAQTRLPDEIVVVDDCSPDDTVAVVEAIARTAPVPMVVLRMPTNTGGPAGPLNRGIEIAKGDLIATLDHDDIMEANRLRDQEDAFACCPDVGIVLGRCTSSDIRQSRDNITELGWQALTSLNSAPSSKNVSLVKAKEAYQGLILHGCYALTCSTFLFPKRVWASIGGFDPRIRTSCDFDLLEKITRQFDIAYVHSDIVTWTSRVDTLHARSACQRRLRDEWNVISRFGLYSQEMLIRQQAKVRQRIFLFDASYELSQQGFALTSLQFLIRSVLRFGLDMKTALSLAKWAPRTVSRLFRRGVRS